MRARRIAPLDVITPAQRAHIETGVYVSDGTLDHWSWVHQGAAERTWAEFSDALLESWVAKHPGTRPFFWWLATAPKTPVIGRHGVRLPDAAAQRLRVGGLGDPAHAHLNVAPHFAFGISTQWIEPWDVAYYSGQAVTVRGEPIGQEYIGSDFRGQAIDPANPPRYESQARFLERHALLLDGERERLPADAWEPETVSA